MADSKKQRSNKTTPLSELAYGDLQRLGSRLDLVCEGNSTWWRKLIEAKSDKKYDVVTVAKLSRSGQQPGGSPGYELLVDMGNRGTTLGELVSLLKKIQFYDALKELGYKEDVKITKHPNSTPVMRGQRLKLECTAEGIPAPSFQWFRGKQPLIDQCSSTLVIEPVQLSDDGIYSCRAMNTANCVFSNWATVQVQHPTLTAMATDTRGNDIPIIQEQPLSQIVDIGQLLNLSCVATCGGCEPLEYQWFKDSNPLLYGRRSSITIDQVQLADQGEYTCTVKSSIGTSVLSIPAKITVNHPGMGHGYPPPSLATMMSPPPSAYHPASDQVFHPPHYPPMMEERQRIMQLGGYNEQFDRQPAGMGLSPSEPVPGGPYTMLGGPPFNNRQYPSDGMGPGSGGLPPPHHLSAHHRDMTPQYSSNSTIHSPDGYIVDPEAGGQDKRCFIDRQCSDKVALLIGNKHYHVQSLQLNTPENDCQDLAGILRSADFKVVSLVNLTKQEMDNAITYFMELIGPNVYSLFFFAGHGFELHQMNYMMAVDCSREKNPELCVCAQDVLRRMQEGGAKLSIVLLDMCRVSAPHHSMIGHRGIYIPPTPAPVYGGYHVFVFSCSPAEKAYEVAGDSDATHEISRISKDNSIFVAALKVHLQVEKHTLLESVKMLLEGIAQQVFRFRPSGQAGAQWQRPEIRHNLPEELSLADAIDPTLLHHQRLQRSVHWRDGHSVPPPVVIGSDGGLLALRLQFEAEHSNVLLVKIEVLQGCLTETVLEHVRVELVQEKPFPMILHNQETERQLSSISMEKSVANRTLVYRPIPGLQKITIDDVSLVIRATFQWREKTTESVAESHTHIITHRMTPPPLYGRITAHYSQEQHTAPIGHDIISP